MRKNDEENAHGRPMLSALAVGENGFPGDGFFVLAKLMGRSLDETPKGKRAFWESEKKPVYEAWKEEAGRDGA